MPTIFASIGALALQWVVSYGAASIAESKDFSGAVGLFFLGFIATIVLSLSGWVMTIRQLALVRVLIGFSPDYVSADKIMFKRKFAILGIYFAGGLFLGIVIMLWFLPALLMSFVGGSQTKPLFVSIGALITVLGLFLSCAVYALAGLIALCVLACEDETVPGIIGRSLKLTLGSFWRALGFGLLLMLVFSVITYPLSLPVVAITLFDLFRHGLATDTLPDTYKAPIYVMVINQVWESLVGLVLRPSIFFAFALFYYDLRMRTEGLDIARRLESLQSRAA